jgi:antitoxin MazE
LTLALGYAKNIPVSLEATMSHVTVGKWGKNLAVRFPGDVARAVGLREGEQVEIESHDGAIIIRHAQPHFTLDELFRGRSPKAWRAAYANAYDWGDEVGREVVEE